MPIRPRATIGNHLPATGCWSKSLIGCKLLHTARRALLRLLLSYCKATEATTDFTRRLLQVHV